MHSQLPNFNCVLVCLCSHLNIIFDCFTGDSNDSYVMIEKLFSLYSDGYHKNGLYAMMLCTSGDRYHCFEELTVFVLMQSG